MTTRTKETDFTTHFKNFVKPKDEFEVWVLGTWVHETGHADVVFTGDQEEAIAFRTKSAVRSTLSIRPTGRTIAA